MDKKQPKYVYVKNKIKEDIQRRVIIDKLPGERSIAEALGISYMTVRKAVEKLVEEGVLFKIPTRGTYVNNQLIPRKQTHNIGFFLDDRIRDGISSPYYSLVFNYLEKEVIKTNYNLTFFSNFNDLNPLKNGKKIDGIIISCFPRLENRIHELKKLIPVVVIDNSSSDKSIPSVIIDNFNGVLDAANYLFSLGHQRIGFITGLQDSNVGKDRLNGFASAVIARGMNEDKALVYKGDYSYQSGQKGAEYFLSMQRPPTAVVCANDSMAIGAIKAIHESGRNVPKDISVVGFDDIDVAAQVHPPLTTVAAPISKIAATSVRMLIDLINGRDLDNRHVALPARLIVRSSCSKAAAVA
jgi:DNA-binding LacI/PurR family transcriptional regulator